MEKTIRCDDVRKMHASMNRACWDSDRNQTGGLMREARLWGIARGENTRTTVTSLEDVRFPDLAQRKFTATVPNLL